MKINFYTFWICTLFSLLSLGQYDSVKNLPLPVKFDGLQQKQLIKSSPNPNFPEFETTPLEWIVWKHSTTIKATENLKIIETGAYLLNNGEWTLRASFKPKQTKKMFATKTLKLKKGEEITFKENWRYGNYTQTGINFWYVIAKTEQGEIIYGYEILETTGTMEDGTEVLPIIPSKSIINWEGKAGDSDYTLTGTVKPSMGKLVFLDGMNASQGLLKIDLRTITSEYDALTNHLQSVDFFDTKKFPIAVYQLNKIEEQEDATFKFIGTLTLLGKKIPQEFTGTIAHTSKEVHITLKSAEINRVEYGMIYASTADTGDTEYSIADQFKISANIFLQKDYPGSMSWNTVTKP